MLLLRTKSSFIFAVAFLIAIIVPSAVADECEDQFTDVILNGDCRPVQGSDQCPAKCQGAFDKLDLACSVDGATLNDEPYDSSVNNLFSLLFFVNEPCNSTIADEVLLRTDDTCQSWGTLYLSTPILFCDDDTVCSKFCKDVADGFYSSCAADDEVMLDFGGTGEMKPMLVSQIVTGAGVFMGDACKEYEEGKGFLSVSPSAAPSEPPSGDSASSSSAVSFSIFPVIVSFVISSAIVLL